MDSVRIQRNADGTYSAYIYSNCVCIGTEEECRQTLETHGESWKSTLEMMGAY
jgi:hypothetical protein